MHSYRRFGDNYQVIFETAKDMRSIHEFKTEDEAAAYVSYLNGGLDPRLTRVQLNPRSQR